VRTFFIPSGSMIPTLQIHDVLLVNEFEYRFIKPAHEDVVVFPPPIESPNDFIKRLIGAPGDTLRIHNGIVYRNGVALDEPYEAQKPNYELEVKNYGIYVDGRRSIRRKPTFRRKTSGSAPDKIPDGCYFMMGDNRNNSEDSHIWGFAQADGTFLAGPLKGSGVVHGPRVSDLLAARPPAHPQVTRGPGLIAAWRRVTHVLSHTRHAVRLTAQAVVLVAIGMAFFLRIPQVTGPSMLPHVQPGELVLINTLAYRFGPIRAATSSRSITTKRPRKRFSNASSRCPAIACASTTERSW
jgi:signal peptidase I